MNRDRVVHNLPIALIALASAILTFWGLTRSGFANTYYAEAAQAASRSWSAWLTNATDASLSVSLDKGPLPNMMLGLSGRLLGFSSFSLLLPEALCGVGAVLLLYDAVRRTLGHPAAPLAAAMLALTPIFVAMSRFDNPDALLVLLEVAAAWALVRALQSGRTRYVLLCGVLVGLAFNVKMLQAYLILPGLAAALLLAGQGSVRRRVAQLAAGAGAMVAVSFVWYGTMMLLPASSRPWVGDTTDNSWFSLIFGANGLGRVSGESAGPAGGGPGGATGFGGSAGLTRLFNDIVGGQIAWLLPLAALGLALGLWTLRRAPRADLGRAAYVLWGGWALVTWLVFSLAAGIFHPYYTTALAPAVAVLAAGGLVLMWERARDADAWTLALAVAVVGTAVLASSLLGRTGGFPVFVAPVTVVLAVAVAGALALVRLASVARRPPLLAGAAVAGLAAILAGPAAYSIATTGRALSGGNPLAGPRQVERASGPGGPGLGRHGAFALAARGGAPPIGGAPRPGIGGQIGVALVHYLQAHRDGAKYIVAAEGSGTAGSIALQSKSEAIDMGGFMGADPAPSLAKLRSLVESGELRYVLLSGSGVGAGPGARQSSGARATITARDIWVRNHGTVVHTAGLGSGGLTLYYIP